jgi:MFS family permease
MKQPKFMLTMYSITNMKVIFTALQYWVPNYMEQVLGRDTQFVIRASALTFLSENTLGSLVGGAVSTKFLGGYTNRKSIVGCLALLILLSLASLPTSFISSPYLFIVLIWIVMFIHGFIEPILTGIILNFVEPSMKNTASSILIFFEMTLGYLPAPYVYGLLVDYVPVFVDGVNKSPWGLRGITLYSLIGVVILSCGILIKGKNI